MNLARAMNCGWNSRNQHQAAILEAPAQYILSSHGWNLQA